MLDLQAEKKRLDEAGIRILQTMKTGALIRYASEAGAILGDASRAERNALVKYGNLIGQAFQLADDILDVTSTAERMGKKVAKDGDRGKGTLVGLYGLDKAQDMADELVKQAIKSLKPFGGKAATLIDCANYMVTRKS